ncbi:hypothetical protein ACQKMD_06930 [Viridibacillus sp. NPDC096237]|uniref:hypothetical protein n=1 Tax=Viridibacillus sp. NPDC096237 TaxID=3390721 RepID=UPI003CFDDC1E
MKNKIVKNEENIKDILDFEDEVNVNGIDGLLFESNNGEKEVLGKCVDIRVIQPEVKMNYWKARVYFRNCY